MSGYVRIHRSLIGHPAFRNDAEAMAFAWLVARAAWRQIRVRYKERGIRLERGQLAISVREFAAAMDRDKAWIERLLKRLRNEGMIETVSETGVTVITVCNYAQYQSDPVLCETPSETPQETRRETGARQAQDTEQGKEKGKKEKIAVPDWMPIEEWEAFKEMRRKMRSVPFTEAAERTVIGKIASLKAEGHDPAKLLSKAVERGHRTVFEDETTKARGGGKVELSAQQLRERAEWYIRHGQPDQAAECRRKAIAKEQGIAA